MITWIILLFVGGMILILAEFVVPGAICGTLGALMLVGSCALGWRYYPEYALFIMLAEAIGVVGCVIGGILMLPRTSLGRHLILADSQLPDQGWVAAESDQALMGTVGEVLTALRPAGTILIGGKRRDAVSIGTFIDQGAKVRVLEVHGSRIVVEQTREDGIR